MKHSGRKYVKALINLVLSITMLLLIILLVPRLLVFFSPFAAGWIISLVVSPFVRFFEERLRLKRKAGSVFVIVVAIGLVVLCAYLIGAKLVREAEGLISSLPDMQTAVQEDFASIAANLSVIYDKLPVDLQQAISNLSVQTNLYMGDLLGRIGTPTLEAVGNFAKQLPTVIIAIIMCLLSSYFFVAERDQVTSWCRNHMPLYIQERHAVIRRSLLKAVGGYFKAQLRIELWVYLLVLIGLTILRVEYALLIALGIAFMDILPFFGTGTIMLPWALVKILSSDYSMAIGLLIIWGVGQLVRQVIQPKIVGDSIGVPPIPTLFLLFIGFRLGGVIGMIISVPVGLIFYTLYEEGAFDTTKNSLQILVYGLNRFRHLEPEDLEIVEEKNNHV